MAIVAIAAMTIDGKIARHSRELTDWTSPEDKELLTGLLDKSDVIVIGNSTYKTAEGPLSKRDCIVLTRSVSTTERRGEKLLFCNPDKVALPDLLRPFGTVALLGGTQTYTYFLQRDLMDELYLTIEPVIFGSGLNLFEGTIGSTVRLRLKSVEKLNDNGAIVLHYCRR
ncbi:MAG: dihydrofolate reductase family protein [Candidatus Acidiferrales bacterium]|jgi:dihydrofolate reductase